MKIFRVIYRRIKKYPSKSVLNKLYKANKETALKIATEKVEHFNQFYNFKYNKISIRNQKTRWGSCSKKGNLNFNFKIALLPNELADYLVVHEICHLGEFNHSENFWKLVSKQIPNYKVLRGELRGFKINLSTAHTNNTNH